MVLDFLRRGSEAVVPEAKASAAGPVIAHMSAGRVAWTPRDTTSLTKQGFINNPVGYRAIKLIAESVASLPMVLQNTEQRFDEHPMLSILNSPNPAQGRAELIEALVGQVLLSGDGYLECVCGQDGVPLEVHVLRSDRIRLVPGRDGWPIAYEYSVGAQKHVFDVTGDVSPICHIKSFHPQDDHYGLGPLQSAAQAFDVHNSASRWSKGLLDNAARPSGAIVWNSSEGQGNLSTEQYNRLVSEMEANYQGARNAGRPMLLEGGLDWKQMGFSPSDMEFQKTKESAARDIAIAFGVPPMLLGIPGEATYANYAEAHRAFYRLTVLPLATKTAAAIGRWLGDWFEEQVHLKPDLDQVPALAGERDAQWHRVANADFLTSSEKRQILGLPPILPETDGGTDE